MALDLGYAGDVRSPEGVKVCHCVLVANGSPLAPRGLLLSNWNVHVCIRFRCVRSVRGPHRSAHGETSRSRKPRSSPEGLQKNSHPNGEGVWGGKQECRTKAWHLSRSMRGPNEGFFPVRWSFEDPSQVETSCTDPQRS